MRRVYIIIGLWFVLLGISALAFGGGPKIVKVSDPPNDVVAGQPYVVNLMVTRYGRRLRLRWPLRWRWRRSSCWGCGTNWWMS